MPWRLPAARPPWLLSASIFTAPNVERHRPSARLGSICCGGGAPFWPLAATGAFWLELEPELELDLADPAAAAQAARTAATRTRFPTLIAPIIPARPSAPQGDSGAPPQRRQRAAPVRAISPQRVIARGVLSISSNLIVCRANPCGVPQH